MSNINELNELYKELNEILKRIGEIYIQKLDPNEKTGLKCVEYKNATSNNWNKICKDCEDKFEEVDKNSNLYVIYIKDEEDNLKVQYIGVSKTVNTRLKQHLFKKSDKTSSKLEKIKDYIINEKKGNGKVYYKAIKVQTNVRTAIEDILIDKSNSDNQLWNIRKNN